MANGNRESEQGGLIRHTVVLPKEESDAVEKMAERNNLTTQGALRTATSIGAWVDEEQQSGSDVTLVKDGKEYKPKFVR
jgi:hypothetical protein